MPILGILVMPDPSRTRVCPAVNAMTIAAVASDTHARAVPSRKKAGVAAACTTAVWKCALSEYSADRRRRGALPAWQVLRLAWNAAPALALATWSAGSRGRRDGVAR
eukprot:2884034-Pleurochrysis_carterae.AAC.1